MTAIAEGVFEFVDDYVDSLADRSEPLTELEEDTGLVFFCREFFNQFLVQEFGEQVETFSSRSAVTVWVNVQPKLDDPSDRRHPIVAAFREFCQDYDTIIGEHYDRGGQLTEFQTEFVPELLASIYAWADADELELAGSADAALGALHRALDSLGGAT